MLQENDHSITVSICKRITLHLLHIKIKIFMIPYRIGQQINPRHRFIFTIYVCVCIYLHTYTHTHTHKLALPTSAAIIHIFFFISSIKFPPGQNKNYFSIKNIESKEQLFRQKKTLFSQKHLNKQTLRRKCFKREVIRN